MERFYKACRSIPLTHLVFMVFFIVMSDVEISILLFFTVFKHESDDIMANLNKSRGKDLEISEACFLPCFLLCYYMSSAEKYI